MIPVIKHALPSSYRSIGKLDRFDFPDLWSFREELNSRPIDAKNEDKTEGSSFYGHTDDYAQADALAVDGVPTIERDIMAQRQEDLAALGCMIDVQTRYLDVSGNEPCIEAYLQGEPECMYNPATERRPGSKILKVLCTYGGVASITHEMMIRRGAACLILCDALENSGYRVEITAAHLSQSGQFSYLYSIGVKRAEEPLDIARLAYILCHAAFFRRHTWRHLASMPDPVYSRYEGGHMAGTANPPAEYVTEINPDVYLSDTDMLTYFRQTDRARDWIRQQFQRFSTDQT